jgi:pimeloyl-ACP methyl ester carboxylesterase
MVRRSGSVSQVGQVGGAAPDGSYRALATGQDVLALIEALGAEQADLIGHDFGARAAYAAASLDAQARPNPT